MIVFLIAALSGIVPPALGAAVRVAWVSTDASALMTCSLPEPGRWSCDDAVPTSAGVVILVGESGDGHVDENSVAFMVHSGGVDGEMQLRRHARLIALAAGVRPDYSEPIRAVAATVDRPDVRPKTTRFTIKPLDGVDVIAVSPGALWVAWNDVDPDAFITVTGQGIASVRIRLASLADGDVGDPFLIAASPALTLSGRVETKHGEAVSSTDVELFAPLDAPPMESSDADVIALPMLRTGRTATDDAGVFAFDGVGPGPFVVSVIDATRVEDARSFARRSSPRRSS